MSVQKSHPIETILGHVSRSNCLLRVMTVLTTRRSFDCIGARSSISLGFQLATVRVCLSDSDWLIHRVDTRTTFSIVKKYSLAHMYATLVGLIVIVAGVWLFRFVTSCGIGKTIYDYTRQKCLTRKSFDSFYAYRPYGLVLIVLGLIFIYGVYRSASQQAEPE
jgi:hypothetical protein